MEAALYTLNGKGEFLKEPAPISYTNDQKVAHAFRQDLSRDIDDLMDEAERDYVMGTLKTMLANDPDPDQRFTVLVMMDGQIYYRIDFGASSQPAAYKNKGTPNDPACDAYCAALAELMYDSMLSLFGPGILKSAAASIQSAISRALGGQAGFSAGPGDDADAIVQQIKEQTKADIVKPKETLADYVCDGTLREQLLQIIDFFDNRDKYVSAGVEIPKGILFKGPPGTGKTFAARCIAGTVDCYFMTCTASSLQGMYIGSGAGNIQAVFKGARALSEASKKGVIIFMDELDSFSSRGNSGGASDEVNRTINQLLAEMSGFEDSDNIMVMGATNYDGLIDSALLRSGRFGRQITIDYPSDDQRESMLSHYAKKLSIPCRWDCSEAAALTKTFTPADIKEVVHGAAIKAVRNGASEVSLADLNEAINEVITKDIRKPDDPKTLALVTAHECGHVLTEVLLKGTVPTKVTNYAYGDAGGFTQPSEVLTGIVKNTDIVNEVRMLLGGRAAEEVCMGYVTTGASNDLEKAKRLLKNYYSRYNFEAYEVDKLDQIIVDKIDGYYRETVDLLKANRATLDALVSELGSKRVLYSSDIAAASANILMKGKPIK